MSTQEDENKEEEEIQEKINQVPKLFFEAESPSVCIKTIFDSFPPVLDTSFDQNLTEQIEIAEKSISIISDQLTQKVLGSQHKIFGATDQIMSLNENVLQSTNFIHLIRGQVQTVRDKTLDPIVNILTQIRDLRRDTQSLVVLHFIQTVTTIHEILHKSDPLFSSYIFNQSVKFFGQNDAVYSEELLSCFSPLTFSEFPTNILHVPTDFTIGKLRKLKCVQTKIQQILQYNEIIYKKLESMIQQCINKMDKSIYSTVVVSYCLLTQNPPIPSVLYDYYSGKIRQQSVAYVETNSNDLQTLFRFMESSYSMISSFKQFIEIHESSNKLSSFVSDLPIETNVVLLNHMQSDSEIQPAFDNLKKDFASYYSQLTHFSESNVLQMLSRIKCTSLDPLSFIRLTKALKEFNAILSCSGLSDWIEITAAEFLNKCSAFSTSTIKKSILKDSWVPISIDDDFLTLVMTMPSDEKVFETNTDNTLDPRKICPSVSAMHTVRVIHSLICLSLELDSNTCFDLIVQVTVYFIVCVMDSFCSPITILENNDLNPKLKYLFDTDFFYSSKYLFRLLTFRNSLPEVKTPDKGEIRLMQLLTAMEGVDLIHWYLSGIRNNVEIRVKDKSVERIKVFYSIIYSKVLPNLRRNLSSTNVQYFLPMKTFKYQIMATDWNINEVNYEYHSFVGNIKKILETFDKQITNLNLSVKAKDDLWIGVWNYLSNLLVNAFGSVKSCNNFGRSLMLGDTRAVNNFFVGVTKIEVSCENVLEFINAFFYQPKEFEMWLANGCGKYKQKNLVNLVKTGLNCKLSKKEMNEMITKIEAKFAQN
ncbi:hypothetical protein GPJ56_004307 [Histomonas meleagridis]|uniref:uncharacterized protein n=1 Tax=Histomonas meleagridis TaxID=135588 RepID=UPI00355A5B68|nr:hypothetical protein GPJ56_004307 [Histomonas meleagridis]KAH0800478.1 hypothetical protein GO595_006681 [Histomonas meleagridis]